MRLTDELKRFAKRDSRKSPGIYDPPDFALRLAHKDVTLATALGREMDVPMPMANLALAELTQALRKYSFEHQRMPKTFGEVVAAGYVKQVSMCRMHGGFGRISRSTPACGTISSSRSIR